MDAFKKESYQDRPLLYLESSTHELTEGGVTTTEGSTLSVTDARVCSPHVSSTNLLPQDASISVLTAGSLYSDLQLDDSSPVANCIARYLGIDISPQAAIEEMRRGLALVICGSPYSGKTTHSNRLGTLYDVPVVTLDGLIVEAVSLACTPSGCKARELSMEVKREIREAEVEPPPIDTPLASKVSMPPQRKPSRLLNSAKDITVVEVKKEQPKPFKVLQLVESDYAVADGVLFSSNLPEDLIVDILTDRLLQTDCRKGIVFDGLQSMFTPDQALTAVLILKALQNRKHIYFIDLELNIEGVKKRVEDMEREKQKLLGKTQSMICVHVYNGIIM